MDHSHHPPQHPFKEPDLPEADADQSAAALESATSRISTVALTKPIHVRKAAAALYNQGRKQWTQNISAHQMRALASVLSLAQRVIMETEVEARVTAMEEQLGLKPRLLPPAGETRP